MISRPTPTAERPQPDLPPLQHCDLCGGIAVTDDFNPTAGLFVCPVCLEHLAEHQS